MYASCRHSPVAQIHLNPHLSGFKKPIVLAKSRFLTFEISKIDLVVDQTNRIGLELISAKCGYSVIFARFQ